MIKHLEKGSEVLLWLKDVKLVSSKTCEVTEEN